MTDPDKHRYPEIERIFLPIENALRDLRDANREANEIRLKREMGDQDSDDTSIRVVPANQ